MWIIVYDPENGEWQIVLDEGFKTREEAEKWLDDNA